MWSRMTPSSGIEELKDICKSHLQSELLHTSGGLMAARFMMVRV